MDIILFELIKSLLNNKSNEFVEEIKEKAAVLSMELSVNGGF